MRLQKVLFNTKTLVLALFLSHLQPLQAVPPSFNKNNYLDGITLDSTKSLPKTIKALQAFPYKLTVRIVFDPGRSPLYYKSAIEALRPYSFIMGEITDSFSYKKYGLNSYKKRVTQYIDQLSSHVDIWEIGNEINGEWLGQHVPEKLNAAYLIAKQKKVITAVTFFYNEACPSIYTENKMFTWIKKNVTEEMRKGLDYVFVSYYPDNCEGSTAPDWPTVFNQLHQLFPNSKLGFGEVGTPKKANKAALINEYYRLIINEPNYIGGYFWWYFRQDMVPASKPLYSVLKKAIEDRKTSESAAGKRVKNN